ncbi:hypothetical protein MJ547_04370, partial [Burkholderia gladioli]
MAHHHLRHSHSSEFLDDLVQDAGSEAASTVRQALGYPNDATFFEEAPAGVLAHEALMLLYLACTPEERAQRRENGWSGYLTLRQAYLEAAVVFGRADLLATVLLDSVGLGGTATRGIAPGEVHRNLPMSVFDAVLERADADLLNTSLVVDLVGTYHLPVWVAMLLAMRPASDRYRKILVRFQKAGATGFRTHLFNKHPLLLNREALNVAIDHVDAIEHAPRRAPSPIPREAPGTVVNALRDPAELLAIIDELPDPSDTRVPEPSEQAHDEEPADATERYMQDVEAREAAQHERDASGVPMTVESRLHAWGWNATLTGEQENAQRARLGLPPRVVLDAAKWDRQRVMESQLVLAITQGRFNDVRSMLERGVDPDTPHHIAGLALAGASIRSARVVGLLLAYGANPVLRFDGMTALSRVCKQAHDLYVGGFEDRETMEDTIDVFVQRMGLLVRAGATASQSNDQKDPPEWASIEGNDAWHWLRAVPPMYEAYLEAVEQRKAIEEDVALDLASVRRAVKDYPEQVKQAALDALAMLDHAKRVAGGQTSPGGDAPNLSGTSTGK